MLFGQDSRAIQRRLAVGEAAGAEERTETFQGGAIVCRDVEIELPTGKILRVTLANAERRMGAPFAPGEAVALGWAREAGLVLEP